MRCRSAAIASSETSQPQYVSQDGATSERINPLPTPISSTRRGRNAMTRSTVASRHARMSASGMGAPS
jgi:hypothetical protein